MQRGHEVEAIAFTEGRAGHERRDGVAVTRVAPAIRLGNTPLHPALFWRLQDKIRSWKPHVVVAHAPVPFGAEMSFLAARRHETPFVLTYHAGELRGSNPALEVLAALDRASLHRRMIAGSAQVIGVSPYVRRHALRARVDGAHVVAPGVDPLVFRATPMPSQPSVLFIGPLDSSYRWKGVDVLLDAFDIVHQRMPKAQLTLVGKGDRLDEIRARARASGADIRVPGRLSDAAIATEYQRCSLLVLPSTTDAEAFGMVLAEANASGRPVVGSDIGGIPDFVTHGRNGLLARPGDPADLADKILGLLANPRAAASMGERGRRHVVRHHDWDDLARATESVFVLAAHSSPIPVLNQSHPSVEACCSSARAARRERPWGR